MKITRYITAYRWPNGNIVLGTFHDTAASAHDCMSSARLPNETSTSAVLRVEFDIPDSVFDVPTVVATVNPEPQGMEAAANKTPLPEV